MRRRHGWMVAAMARQACALSHSSLCQENTAGVGFTVRPCHADPGTKPGENNTGIVQIAFRYPVPRQSSYGRVQQLNAMLAGVRTVAWDHQSGFNAWLAALLPQRPSRPDADGCVSASAAQVDARRCVDPPIAAQSLSFGECSARCFYRVC